MFAITLIVLCANSTLYKLSCTFFLTKSIKIIQSVMFPKELKISWIINWSEWPIWQYEQVWSRRTVVFHAQTVYYLLYIRYKERVFRIVFEIEVYKSRQYLLMFFVWNLPRRAIIDRSRILLKCDSFTILRNDIIELFWINCQKVVKNDYWRIKQRVFMWSDLFENIGKVWSRRVYRRWYPVEHLIYYRICQVWAKRVVLTESLNTLLQFSEIFQSKCANFPSKHIYSNDVVLSLDVSKQSIKPVNW